jgi:hypothetical protein
VKNELKILGPEKNRFSEKLPKDDLHPLFRLIYVYKHINRGSKFTVPHTIHADFLSNLQALGLYLDKPLQNLLKVYEVKGKDYG